VTLRSAIIVGALVIIDQVTKFIASSSLKMNESVSILDGFFHITLTHNTGAAFGIFKGMLPAFIFLSVITVFIIILYTKKLRHDFPFLGLGLLLVLAGTIGNLIDRIRLGYVIDFIDIKLWSVFNVADTTISVGGALLVYHILTTSRRHKAKDVSGTA